MHRSYGAGASNCFLCEIQSSSLVRFSSFIYGVSEQFVEMTITGNP